MKCWIFQRFQTEKMTHTYIPFWIKKGTQNEHPIFSYTVILLYQLKFSKQGIEISLEAIWSRIQWTEKIVWYILWYIISSFSLKRKKRKTWLNYFSAKGTSKYIPLINYFHTNWYLWNVILLGKWKWLKSYKCPFFPSLQIRADGRIVVEECVCFNF